VRDRRQIAVTEPAVRPGETGRAAAGDRYGRTHRGEQAEHVAVPEHPG
jgi:hypothetical protein